MKEVKKAEKRIAPLVALAGLMCGCCCDKIATTEPHIVAKICELAAKGDFKSATKWQGEANQVVELMIESDNWSYRKAMMKFIGLDCGSDRRPFEPLTPAQYTAYAKRFAKLGIVKQGAELK